MIRVGLIVSFRGGWQGGTNYVRNLLSCYQKYPDPDVQLHVFVNHPEDGVQYRCDAVAIHHMPSNVPGGWTDYPRRIRQRLLGYDPRALGILKRQRIDLLSHYSLGKQTKIDTLQWQPDFQHRVYPEYFDAEERAYRDATIRETGRWGKILLSSHAAENDFRHFYPELASVKTHVLHFSSGAILDVAPMSRAELSTQYPVGEPYFFLPNQFWKHKNHKVVVDALRQTRREIRVICCGRMDDYRDPNYIENLFAEVKSAGVEDRFIALGSVPYPALVSLMHHSIAVLQPSLFEGWSTSVEESKAMCKRIILSDLDVHVEQAPERGSFFSALSSEELAANLERVNAEFDPVIEEAYTSKRQQNQIDLERSWIIDFVRIVKNAIAARAG